MEKPYPDSSTRILVKETYIQEQRHGSDAIIKLIEETFRNGWLGIFFDRLDTQTQKGSGKELRGADAYFAMAQEGQAQ